MGIFRKQSIRLLREDWTSTKEAMEELYAILNSDEPLEIDGPVTINNNTEAPAITVNQRGNTDQSIKITKTPEPPGEDEDYPPEDFPDDVGKEIDVIIDDDGIEVIERDPDTGEEEERVISTGGGGFPGKVISGSGSTYQVDVYESGLSLSPTRRTVTQLQIAEDATIPANTWALVGKVGSDYFMQVPVWLEDLS